MDNDEKGLLISELTQELQMTRRQLKLAKTTLAELQTRFLITGENRFEYEMVVDTLDAINKEGES